MDIDVAVSDVSARLQTFVAEVEVSVEKLYQELEAERASADSLDRELFCAVRMLTQLITEDDPRCKRLERLVATLNAHRNRRGAGEVVTLKDGKLDWKARNKA